MALTSSDLQLDISDRRDHGKNTLMLRSIRMLNARISRLESELAELCFVRETLAQKVAEHETTPTRKHVPTRRKRQR